MNGTAASPICPCDSFVHPLVINNAAALQSIHYSAGIYLAFRHALLLALPDEQDLWRVWRPGAEGDLAVQMVEWWAYLSDILCFYNERIATESYLRTATLPESINRLIQVIGYRPRPALGSRGTLAALLSGASPVVLPKRMEIQSKPGPGKQPQTFELDAETRLAGRDVVTTRTIPSRQVLTGSSGNRLLLAGRVSGIKLGEKLLLTNASGLQGTKPIDFAWLTINAISDGKDVYGKPVTQLDFQIASGSIPANADPASFVLLRSGQSLGAWTYSVPETVVVVDSTKIELASIARGLDAGQLAYLDDPKNPATVIVGSNIESVWYANGDGPTPSAASPPPSPVSVLHATITFADQLNSAAPDKSKVILRWNWTAVGKLVPDLSSNDVKLPGSGGALQPQGGTVPQGTYPVLLADAGKNGASAIASIAGGGTIALSRLSAAPEAGLLPPIDVLFNLLAVSRGKTVPNEVLGSGNATIAGQDFALSQSPVTYQQDPASKSGDNFSSTVRVWVNEVEWREARSFYDQKSTAQIFVLREDETGKTHVQFGDGVNGARLPTGVNNVVATYRFQAGAEAPAPGTLTTALNPPPGLKGLVNPLAPTQGADADPPERIRALAPASIFTFGRAVSLEDYQAIAANAAGVTHAKADFVFDAVAERPVVTLWVAGDSGAVASTRAALAGTADPNRPVRILPASAVQYRISLTYVIDPRQEDSVVRAALHDALVGADNGLFGVNAIDIGEVIYDSQICQACLAVPGVQAIHALSFEPAARHVLRRRRFRRLTSLSRPAPGLCAGEQHDPGPGGYFVVPDDAFHVRLSAGGAA
ncbi:hypothetical protein XI09_05250 [Bradyrhizobium sp. CCBAU 11386]|uniref:hypothetical protein n=1 Tax=Bradyrhizobium sp. CCBAU 11386 TaxID=1630837 RepID=UPI002304A5BB|nr:hypothetical protein [Bradyrhizobium sp. CCBAU 11386]MDA9504178.1 hypothetical protein [Bradyrhizobium sp. CCBAU 11386]